MAAMLAADAHVQVRAGGPPQSTASFISLPTPLTSSTSKGLSCRIWDWLYSGRNLFSASSRENEKVAWVRSLVPKEKNSASCARDSARMQARTTSIMVPNLKLTGCRHTRPPPACVDLVDVDLDRLQLLHRADLRHLDLRLHLDAGLGALGRGLEDGADLHLVDLREGDTQTHAAMAEHRVGLVQGTHLLQHGLLLGDGLLHHDRVDQPAQIVEVVRHLVRRVQQAHGAGQRGHAAGGHGQHAQVLKSCSN
jgi:hypothetical protein